MATLGLELDLARLRAEMAKIPGISKTEAKRMVSEMNTQMRKAEKAATKAAKNSRKEWSSFGREVQGVGLALAGAAYGWVRWQQANADAVNDLNDLSTRTGQSAEDLQAWGLAAESSGSSLSELQGAFAGLPKRLADTARGIGDARYAFDDLGMSATNADGSLRDASEVTREFFATIKDYPDVEKAALATQVFGKSGTKLLQALSGRELDEFVSLSREWAVDVGPEATKAAAEWQAQMALLKTSFAGMSQELVSAGGDGAEILNRIGQVAVFAFTFAKEQLSDLGQGLKDFVLSFKSLGDIESPTDLLKAIKDIDVAFYSAVSQPFQFADALELATEKAHAYAQTLGRASPATAAFADAQGSATTSTAKTTTAIEDQTGAVKDWVKEYLSAHRELSSIAATAATARLSDEERILKAMDLQIAKVRELNETVQDQALTEQAILDIRAEAYGKLAEIQARHDSEREARLLDIQATEQAGIDALRASWEAASSATASMFGTLSEFFLMQTEELAEGQSEAAEKAFKKYKAFAYGEAILSAILAGVRAFGDYPFPASLAVAAVAAGAAGLQVAKIASTEMPTYHTGGIIGSTGGIIGSMAPDEGVARVVKGEGVLTGRGVEQAGGAAGVAAMNRGDGGGQTIVVPIRIGHRDLGEVMAVHYRLPGSGTRGQIRNQTGALAGRRRRS